MGNIKRKIFSIIGNVIAIITSLVVMIPLIVLLINSFKSSGEANSMSLKLPEKWMFENYLVVIEQETGILLFQWITLCDMQVLIYSCVSGTAFVISRNFKGINKFVYYFIIAGIAMPLTMLP